MHFFFQWAWHNAWYVRHDCRLCAAPGSKTLQILDLMQPQAERVVVQVDCVTNQSVFSRCINMHQPSEAPSVSARFFEIFSLAPNCWGHRSASCKRLQGFTAEVEQSRNVTNRDWFWVITQWIFGVEVHKKMAGHLDHFFWGDLLTGFDVFQQHHFWWPGQMQGMTLIWEALIPSCLAASFI